MKWIPRRSNSEADKLSKIIDFDDYTLNYDVFPYARFSMGPALYWQICMWLWCEAFPFQFQILSTRDWSCWCLFTKLAFWEQLDSPSFADCEGDCSFECVKRREHLLFLCGSHRIFGRCCVTTVDIGTRFFTIGLYFRNPSNSLWETKLGMTCMVQESCPS